MTSDRFVERGFCEESRVNEKTRELRQRTLGRTSCQWNCVGHLTLELNCFDIPTLMFHRRCDVPHVIKWIPYPRVSIAVGLISGFEH